METQLTDMLFGTGSSTVAPILGASFTAITGKLPPAHWLTTRIQTMTSSSDYMRGRNAKLAGLGYDPTRALDWRMGWLETNPDLNLDPEIPEDWERQVQSYRNGVQSGDSNRQQNRMGTGEVMVTVGLSPAQAEALAHFVNRVGTREVRGTAGDDDEAGQMRDAIIALADALMEAGYSQR